jgi:nitrogen fixation protein
LDKWTLYSNRRYYTISMADNVNIIVQDTINDIVVNAAVVVETIDINVQAAVDVVDIVANPNNYVVNINRIIGEQVQSDWTQTDNQAPDYIKNKPTIPAAQVNSDWDATSGVAEILNKPTIPTNTSDLVNDGENGVDPFITAADIPPVTGFVPYTGATANVDLGEYELKAGQVTLDTTPTGTAAVATTRWNDSIGTTETTLKGGSVVLKNGIDLVARVVNKVTPNTTLTKAAYQAVRISGAQGQRLAVAYAQANNDNNSADTIGIVCETIATNQEGFILTVGQLEEINTTGSLQGETWADGDVLYLSPTTAGRLTNIKPTGATGHIVVMGYVEYAHAVHGKIYVKIMNGWELDELHNVYINAPANNEGLFYDSADSLWKNETIASALGYTPVTNARTISTTAPLSGGGDLSANRTLSITQATTSTDGYLSSTNWNTFNGKFTLPALTSGSVLFSNGTTIAQDNSNLFWDDTNNRLGINTNAPFSSVTATVNGLDIGIWNSAGNEGNLTVRGFASLGGITRSSYGAVGSNYYLDSANGLRRRVADSVSIIDFAAGAFLFKTAGNAAINSSISLTELMRINANGNVLIGTTTDAGYKLDVNGTARVQANLNMVTGNAVHLTTGFTGRDGNCIYSLGSATFLINNRNVCVANFYNGGSDSNQGIQFGIGIGTGQPPNTASAILDLTSTTKGFLPPRLTTTQKNAIVTPAAGLVVYDTTLGKLCVRTASSWETITSI